MSSRYVFFSITAVNWRYWMWNNNAQNNSQYDDSKFTFVHISHSCIILTINIASYPDIKFEYEKRLSKTYWSSFILSLDYASDDDHDDDETFKRHFQTYRCVKSEWCYKLFSYRPLVFWLNYATLMKKKNKLDRSWLGPSGPCQVMSSSSTGKSILGGGGKINYEIEKRVFHSFF